ncbi:MAG: hypothetical protein L0Y71_24650 [Gemmataceae bacterium]|nr:hypothetical protein [Gemmataceae bacterium]
MIARREPLAPAVTAVVSDQYVVAFGKSGGLGCFTVIEPLELERGDQVVVRTPRGLELGEVLGQATLRQARLIGAQASGDILRRASGEDRAAMPRLQQQAEDLFAATRAAAARLALPVQILDVEMLLDGRHALVQFVGGGDADVTKLVETLSIQGSIQGELQIRFENLAGPHVEHDDHSHGGCDKPDCGRVNGAGGCATCATGGGCSSCGSGQPDLRAYFAHLRGKMEETHRIPLH